MKINNRQQWLAIVAGAAVALLLGDRLVLTPLTKSWADRSARLVELRKLVTNGEAAQERERAVRSRWDGMRTNTLSADVSLAEQQLLKAFDRWSQDAHISITSLKPQWRHTADDYLTLECRVDAFGSLATVSRFLYNVEKDAMAVKVEAVELSARDNTGNQLTLGLQVSGLVLQAPEKR